MRNIFRYIIGSLVLLAACSAPQRYTAAEYRQYSIHTEAVDSGIYREILPYHQQLEKEMGRVIGYADAEMPKIKGKPETVLGNFVADLVKKTVSSRFDVPVSFCLLNTGGLRNSLPQGNITVGNIYELMPFDNELVLLTLNGTTMQKLADYLAASGGHPVSGLRMEINSQNRPEQVMINDQPLNTDSTARYFVITSDYLANGGDNMNFFAEALHTQTLQYKLRDCIIDYIESEQKAGRHLGAALDGRITRTANP